MPHIQITMLEGRTTEQKRKVVERITATMIEEIGTTLEAISISLIEVPPTNFARAGTLAIDKKK